MSSRLLPAIEAKTSNICRFVNAIGVCALALTMLTITTDVLSRFFFNLPVKGSIEIVGSMLILTILFSIPYTAVQNQHVNITIITSKLSSKKRDTLQSIATFIALILCILVVWRSILFALVKAEGGEMGFVLQLPDYPFVLLVAFGFALTAWVYGLQLFRRFSQSFKSLRKIIIWCIAGIIILLIFYWLVYEARELPWKSSLVTTGIIGLVLLFAAFLSGLPIFLDLMLVGFLGMAYLRGSIPGFILLGTIPYTTSSQYSFAVIPLFVLMGEFCFFSGLGKDLYDMAYKWVGQLPGGLSMGTVAACGGFAAVCGDSLATALTMGSVAIPEMRRYKYSMRLATGCVAAGGTLGVLIPPSLAFIFYAILTEQSISTLFIAGIVPGILLILLFMATIYLRALKNPALGPPGPKTTWNEKIISLKGVWATLVLFIGVMGGMYAGIFTPTEGGAIGAFGAMLIGILRRRLNVKGLLNSFLGAGKITGTCLSILIGANIFGYFVAASKLPMVLADFVSKLPVPQILVLAAILVIYLFLGCIMPAIPMLLLTVPIFYPVILEMGYNPIWFGVIMVIMFEMAVITPPMGINVLALQAVVEDVEMSDIFIGIVPFIFAMILCVIIIIAIPDIALFLPNLLGAK